MLKLLFHSVLNFEPGTLNRLLIPDLVPDGTEKFLCALSPTRASPNKLPGSRRPNVRRETPPVCAPRRCIALRLRLLALVRPRAVNLPAAQSPRNFAARPASGEYPP